MKRRWKIFWLACACLAGAGIALCIAGAVMGATFSGIHKTFISEEIIWKDDDWDLVWDDEEADSRENRENEFTVQNTEDSEYITGYANVRKLDLQVSYAYVKVERYGGDRVILDISSLDERLKKKLRIEVDKSDGALKIETKDKSLWRKLVNTDSQSGRIVIRVPQNSTFAEVSFEIGAGVLSAEKICAGELKINVGAGEAIVKSFEADEMDVECGAGEATLTGTVSRKAAADCGVGQITLNLSGNQTDYDYEVKCGIGDMKVGRSSYSGIGHEQQVYNNASKELELECGVGSVEVNFDGE